MPVADWDLDPVPANSKNPAYLKHALKTHSSTRVLRLHIRAGSNAGAKAERRPPGILQAPQGPPASPASPEAGRPAGDLRRFDHGAEDVFPNHGGLPDDVRARAGSNRSPIRLERGTGAGFPCAHDQ